MMMKLLPDTFAGKYLSLLLLLVTFVTLDTGADALECRNYQLVDSEFDGPERFGKGLLWEINREGYEPSWVFGTMHVDDDEVIDLPEIVLSKLAASSRFVMETVPSLEDTMRFSTEMFFMDGNRLYALIPEDIFNRTVNILQGYNMTADIVALMKPWAAYVIMSYPANMGEVLDLKLLNLARAQGAEVSGLESFREQIDIFSDMPLDSQARILTDVVCHYDKVSTDLSIMKSFYLDRDLEGLYIHSQRYSFGDNSVYDEISARLVTDRNNLMVERMADILTRGNAFIAVGAMHLPGEDGILNLLEMQGYTVNQVY